jgi:hypothetical protein
LRATREVSICQKAASHRGAEGQAFDLRILVRRGWHHGSNTMARFVENKPSKPFLKKAIEGKIPMARALRRGRP